MPSRYSINSYFLASIEVREIMLSLDGWMSPKHSEATLCSLHLAKLQDFKQSCNFQVGPSVAKIYYRKKFDTDKIIYIRYSIDKIWYILCHIFVTVLWEARPCSIFICVVSVCCPGIYFILQLIPSAGEKLAANNWERYFSAKL